MQPQKQNYYLSIISSERIENARAFVHYVWFSQARLAFFFQRYPYDTRSFPMETFFVNNWLFFKNNIFAA